MDQSNLINLCCWTILQEQQCKYIILQSMYTYNVYIKIYEHINMYIYIYIYMAIGH